MCASSRRSCTCRLRVTFSSTSTAAGSPHSPPTPAAASSLTASCGTAAARAEDRIRNGKDTGLTNLPLHGFNANQIWCAVVMLAVELTAWTQLLALPEEPRRWEPKQLRYRLFTVPAVLARTRRQVLLHLAGRSLWASLLADAVARLRALAVPGG
jgi:DDE family transposase